MDQIMDHSKKSPTKGRLVLSRKKGQSIVIGAGENKITVTVAEILDQTARLAIESPRNVPVNRYEIAEKKNLI